MAIPTGHARQPSSRIVDSARRIPCVDASQAEMRSRSAERSQREEISRAIRSASSRGPMPPSVGRVERVSIAARHRRSWRSSGSVSSGTGAQGGNRHQEASTLRAKSGSRDRSEARVVVRRSSQGSIRGTAQTAMVMAPCTASSSPGIANPLAPREGHSSGPEVSSGAGSILTASSGSIRFETNRAIPASRARSSSVETMIPRIANAGSTPGQYREVSEDSTSRIERASHLPSRKAATLDSGSFAISSSR